MLAILVYIKNLIRILVYPVILFPQIPYVTGIDHPLWSDCGEVWQETLLYLNNIPQNICALIVEPIVQGAGGMLCYSADFLSKLIQWLNQMRSSSFAMKL